MRTLRTSFPIKEGVLQRKTRELHAVDGFSIDLGRGQTLALVGESGSGKTTAGHSILRLLKETRGQISFKGEEIKEKEM